MPRNKHREIPSFVYDPSCVLYLPLWKRDGASFMSDDAYGHTCTVTGATWGLQGRSFDGIDDRIVIPDHNALDIGLSDFTIEAWVKPATDCGTPARIVSKQAAAWYFYRLEGGVLVHNIKDGTNAASVTAVGDLRDAGWHYTAVTCDRDSSTGFQAYIAGVASGAATNPTAVGDITNTQGIDIGRFSGGSEYYKGDIGEFRICTRALSALEIQRNYLETKWGYQ